MKTIQFHGKHILINGEPGILFGGEFQYFRINVSLWREGLVQLKKAGLNYISFYIPWIWHEIEEGFFDFLGETAPERDIIKLIKFCQKQGLSVIIRPGPYIYAEYQGFGIPEWLRQKHPEILIQYENGQKSHEIVLNHPVYLNYVKSWFNALLVVLRPYLKTGVIFAWQIDNETGLPQFGNPPYLGDFNPHTMEYYRKYLNRVFLGDIEKINSLWGTRYKFFDEIMPPFKGKSSLLQNRQWAEFIEDYIVEYLARLKTMLIEMKVDTFFLHNDPYLCQWPHKITKKAEILAEGYDIYSKVTPNQGTHDIPFSISYAPELFTYLNSQAPTIGMEIGAGWLDNRVTVKPAATLQSIMISLLRGTKLVNLYILHDCREADGTPWVFNAPLDINGKQSSRYAVIKSIGKFLTDFGYNLARSTELHNSIAILNYHPQVWDMVKPNFNIWSVMEDLNNALTHFTGPPANFGMLVESGYNPEVRDLETCPLGELSRYRVLFFGSTGILDKACYQKLLDYVMNGGVLITYGKPMTKDLHNNEYEENPLYPAKPYGSYNSLHFGNNSIISQVAIDMVEYQMARRKIQHKYSLYTIDMMEPFSELTKHISKMGTWVDTDKGDTFWATRFISSWHGGSITPLLLYDNMTVGYSARLRAGRSIFLGTLPGLFFESPSYYSFESKKKESVIKFFSTLLKETGIKPLVSCDQNIETILRQTDNGMFVFLINRGGKKEFNLIINAPHPGQKPEIIFTFFNSYVDLVEGQLHGVINEDDVLGFYLKQ